MPRAARAADRGAAGAVAAAARRRGITSTGCAAIDTELSRAALALDDLAVARRGEWSGPRLTALERVDVAVLVADAVEAARGRAHAAGVGLWLVERAGGSAAAAGGAGGRCGGTACASRRRSGT